MSAPTKTSIYLLSWDNGQHWEDHSVWPLYAVPTKARAEAIKREVETWITLRRGKLPPCPSEVSLPA